jgi:hypothetical protein
VARSHSIRFEDLETNAVDHDRPAAILLVHYPAGGLGQAVFFVRDLGHLLNREGSASKRRLLLKFIPEVGKTRDRDIPLAALIVTNRDISSAEVRSPEKIVFRSLLLPFTGDQRI